MSSNRRNSTVLKVLLVVAIVGLAGLALAGTAVATDHVDSLTGDDTDVIEDFNASDDNYIEYTLDADDADFDTDGTEEVAINVSHDDIDHHENTSVEVDGAAADVTFNFSHSELATVPGDALEDTTVNVTAWGEDDDGEITTGPVEFEVDLEFDSDHAVRYYAEGTDNWNDVDEEEFELGHLSSLADSVPFVWDAADLDNVYEVDSTVGIDGNGTSIDYYLAEDDMGDSFEEVSGDYTESETPVIGMTVLADDELVPVFADDVNEDIVDADEDTYAVYDGNDELTIYVGEEHDDEDELDTHVASQNPTEELDFGVSDVLDAYDGEISGADIRNEFGTVSWIMTMLPIGAIALGAVAVVTVRRRNQHQQEA